MTRSLLRSADHGDLVVPRARSTRFGCRSFRVCQQFGRNFHRISKARTLGNSLNVGLRVGYLSASTTRGVSDRQRHALQTDLLTYLFTEGAKRASQSYRKFSNISETFSSSKSSSGTWRNGERKAGAWYLNFYFALSRDDGFLRKCVNFACWCFVKFRNLLRKIAVNSAVDSQLKKFCC